ncbi:MAG: S8 family serine peptidase [Clostridiales bacterium]|nr:S8 family serine peptidase [Clostridiales bacterium]
MDIYPNYLFPYENLTDDTPGNSIEPEGFTDVSRDNSFEPEGLTDMSGNNRFQSEKLENSLQLALDTPQAEREASASLNTGFNEADKTWELIVKYNNSPNFLSYVNSRQIQTDLLLSGYAILTIPESEIPALTRQPFLEFVEQPKRLFFADRAGLSASCIPANRIFYNALPDVSEPPFTLTGKGVLIGIIDSGIDFTNPDFRNPDGSTRIRALYDIQQNRIFSREDINLYLQSEAFEGVNNPNLQSEVFEAVNNPNLQNEASSENVTISLSRAIDFSGHGTAVAGIAASNGASSRGYFESAAQGNGGKYENTLAGVAPEAELLVVKLGPDIPDSFPRTTQLMKAVNWTVLAATEMGMPISINISIGNTYGPHDGSSLLETFLDAAAEVGRTSICVGSGNEGADRGHTSITFGQNETGTKHIPLSIGDYETGLTIQLWKNYSSDCSVSLIAPDGTVYPIVETFPTLTGTFLRPAASLDRSLTISTTGETILVYIGTPVPYSINQELYFDFIPKAEYLTRGIWQFRIEKIVSNPLSLNLYLPVGLTRSLETRFVDPDTSNTITIPSTASRVITVGAYDPYTDLVPDFSGRGYILEQLVTDREATGTSTFFQTRVKPDLVAPGVNIVSNDLLGGYSTFTGTSFAAPFVTGGAALLMEWGIVRGNDRYMYGQKIKATLQRLARQLEAYPSVPNEVSGYGALCLQPR